MQHNRVMNMPHAQQMPATKSSSIINTEEFAKLDALLEDLLAEVEQPIMLNKQQAAEVVVRGGRIPSSTTTSMSMISSNTVPMDDIDRSVDWLSEQKERLRMRREQDALVNQRYVGGNRTAQNGEQRDPIYLTDSETDQSYRRIKSKMGYYVSNSNNAPERTVSARLASYSYPEGAKLSSSNLSYHNRQHQQMDATTELMSQEQEDGSYLLVNGGSNSTETSPTVTMDYSVQCEEAQNGTMNGRYTPLAPKQHLSQAHIIVNNKPPLSPNTRALYSPSQSAQPQQPFRSLSTNPTLLRHISETDDENVIESEFDRYSQRSYRSGVSTVQRSKYHTVSNDFVEATRPAAPTPQPTYNNRIAHYQCKRALSAPPAEVGKVVLQRMELKSPLTVRPGSVVQFAQHTEAIEPPPSQQPAQEHHSAAPHYLHHTNRSQTPLVLSGAHTLQHPHRHYIDNPYNNRGVLYGNSGRAQSALGSHSAATMCNAAHPPRAVLVHNNNGHHHHTLQPQQTYNQQQVVPQTCYMHRSCTETPQFVVNGYETDSVLTNQHHHPSYSYRGVPQPQNGYQTNTMEYRSQEMHSPPPPHFQILNDNAGYDTDTGLIKLRQVLDNRRSGGGTTPQPNGYYYPNVTTTHRTMTPSFNGVQQQRTAQFAAQQNGIQHADNLQQNNGYQYAEQQQQQQQTTSYNSESVQQQQHQSTILRKTEAPSASHAQIHAQAVAAAVSSSATSSSAFHSATQNGGSLNQLSSAAGPAALSGNVSGSVNGVSAPLSNGTAANGTGGARLTSTMSANNISSKQQQQQAEAAFSREDPRRVSANSLADLSSDQQVLRNYPKSVKVTQGYWYKPKISRDEAIGLLKDKQPGTLLIRDSNNFPCAYGLALKVDKPPANVQIKQGVDPLNELVRHFLIEPTNKGVRIKGCCNEPTFGSLAALVYQHSITPLALPIKLILPNKDLIEKETKEQPTPNGNSSIPQSVSNSKLSSHSTSSNQKETKAQDANSQLLEKGAACHVFFLSTVNIEDRTGLDAITYALTATKGFLNNEVSQLLLIQFKVNAQGITLTDVNKKKFLRQHLPTNTVIYCALEDKYTWPVKLNKIEKPRIFGVITRPRVNQGSNECHLFVELDADQPAIAIVDFINRYLIPSKVV